MLKLHILFAFLLAATAAAGQSLRGKITDAQTGEPLIGANIYLPEIGRGAATGLDGTYEIEKIPKGKFVVQVTYVGYTTLVEKLTFSSDSIRTWNPSLKPSAIEAKEIVVAVPYMSSQQENPVQVVQMKDASIRQSSAPTLIGALATLPGVDMISTGASVGKLVIRGLSYNRILIYSHGLRLENQQWGDEHGLGANEVGVGKVEIIKGPSSLLYGADAMGGVLHLVEEQPAPQGTVKGNYNLRLFSNTLGAATDAHVKAAGKTWNGSIAAGYENHADYMDGNGTRITNTRFNEKTVDASLGYHKNWFITKLAFNHLSTELGLPEDVGEQTLERKPESPFQEIQTQLISDESTFLLGKHKVKAVLGFMNNIRQEFEQEPGSAEPEAALDMHLNNVQGDLKWYLPEWKRTEIIFSAQAMHQQNENFGEDVLIPNATMQDAGGGVLAKYHLGKFTALAGARYDLRQIITEENGETGQQGYMPPLDSVYRSINGSVGGSLKLSKLALLRLNLASGFRAPNPAELSSNGVHEGSNRYEIGNPDLQSEQNVEADLGLELQSEHVALNLAVFGNKINNYIFIAPVDSVIDQNPIYTYRQQNALLTGFEAQMDIHPHPLDWLHIETSFSFVYAEQQNGEPLPLIPAHKWRTDFRADLGSWKFFEKSYFKVGFLYSLPQQRVSEFETTTPDYFLVNAAIGTEIKRGKNHAELDLIVNNLLDETYFDHLSRLKPEGIYNMGRNVVLRVSVPFFDRGFGKK